jgi:hypothetical protein
MGKEALIKIVRVAGSTSGTISSISVTSHYPQAII